MSHITTHDAFISFRDLNVKDAGFFHKPAFGLKLKTRSELSKNTLHAYQHVDIHTTWRVSMNKKNNLFKKPPCNLKT